MNEVDEYISGLPAEIQKKLTEIRSLIFEIVPQVSERISWGMPSYYLNGRTLFHIAGFKKHIGFYPTAEGVTAFNEKLSGYKTAKGTVQFPLNKPLPLDLIREIISYRVIAQSKKIPKLPKLKKTLGKPNSPYIVSLMQLVETQSKATIAEWSITYAEENILTIFEKECPDDFRPRKTLLAAREWLAGNMKLPEVKRIILNECHVAARELEDNPVAQAAARACGQVASVVHVPSHSLGLAFYGSAAIAYNNHGLHETDEIYNQCAAEECAKMEAALRAISVHNNK